MKAILISILRFSSNFVVSTTGASDQYDMSLFLMHGLEISGCPLRLRFFLSRVPINKFKENSVTLEKKNKIKKID